MAHEKKQGARRGRPPKGRNKLRRLVVYVPANVLDALETLREAESLSSCAAKHLASLVQ